MHTCTSSLFHCVFATKNREPLLTSDLRSRLWPYLGGIARENGKEGYGAFSISVSGVEETVAYIRNQEEHHRTRPFRDEVIAMLKRHGVRLRDRKVGVSSFRPSRERMDRPAPQSRR